MIRVPVIALAALLTTAAIPAMAQNNSNSEGLVNVTLGDVVLSEIAKNINVQVDVIKNALNNNTIQVPVGVAAAVCGVDANVIADQKKTGDYSCPATTTNNALDQSVKKAVK